MSVDPASTPSFDRVWTTARDVPGWLSEEQARMLWAETAALRPGAVVLEIGSHQGRSTVVLADAAHRRDGRVLAVDAFVEGRLFGGLATAEKFRHTIDAAGATDVVELVQGYSTVLRPSWDRPIDLLYIDGKHDYWTCSDDLRWAAHLPDGGPVLVHDCYSSIGVTLAVLCHVLPSTALRYDGRNGSMARFTKAAPTLRDRLRIVGEMPWWVRNVGLKVLLRLRLRPVARRLGHDSPYDPF